jgi:hypothetical protein
MSTKHSSLGGLPPTGRAPDFAFSLYQACSARAAESSPKDQRVAVPARAAYSHWASVARSGLGSHSLSSSARSRGGGRAWQAAFALAQSTWASGMDPPPSWPPPTALYCSHVSSVRAIQKSSTSTGCLGRSRSSHCSTSFRYPCGLPPYTSAHSRAYSGRCRSKGTGEPMEKVPPQTFIQTVPVSLSYETSGPPRTRGEPARTRVFAAGQASATELGR